MSALAGLLTESGFTVSGSDTRIYPPVGPFLSHIGVEAKLGFDPENLAAKPDRVVIGNVCRPDNPEARAAIEAGMRYQTMPDALSELVIGTRPRLVVAGTHGKTTTTTLLSHLLEAAGIECGAFIGGLAPHLGDRSYRRGAPDSWFVLEGDEYDTAFFEKTPKMWHYGARAAVLTSVEHDHVDIYPTLESYRAAFAEFLERLPTDGLLVAWAGDPIVRQLARQTRARVVFYALSTDNVGEVTPLWTAAPIATAGSTVPFDLFLGGSKVRTLMSPLMGSHNVRNTLAALAVASEAVGAPLGSMLSALPSFRAPRRRQQLLGRADNVHVFDDFAHHPRAVSETLMGIRSRYPNRRLVAVFEPRSATSARSLHESEYGPALAQADVVLLAPVGRSVLEEEKLDTKRVAEHACAQGAEAHSFGSLDETLIHALAIAAPGDVFVFMSNGEFGGLPRRFLAERALKRLTQRI